LGALGGNIVKSRIALVFFAVIATSAISWALYERHETESFMLRMLYLDSTTHIRNNVYILSSLREGRQKGAITHLERLLDTKIAILEGCKNDLCKESAPIEYAEAIKSAVEYKKKYEGK
jgi:hypothetical protein